MQEDQKRHKLNMYHVTSLFLISTCSEIMPSLTTFSNGILFFLVQQLVLNSTASLHLPIKLIKKIFRASEVVMLKAGLMSQSQKSEMSDANS